MLRLSLLWVLTACTTAPSLTERCSVSGRRLSCTHDTLELAAGRGVREVHVAVPTSEAPEPGVPVAILFQGSLFSAEGMWQAHRGAPLGAYHQTRTVEALLAAGFAVVAPEAAGNGATAWNTNVPPHAGDWANSPDAELMDGLLAAIEDGTLGPLDPDALFAAGISSGGYMTSRMAEAYPGRFTALAIHSASWASCAGAVCRLPERLPDDHPPTLFLHGGLDGVVPPGTSRRYHRRLQDAGVPTERRVQPWKGHRWLDIAPDAIVDWFEAHR